MEFDRNGRVRVTFTEEAMAAMRRYAEATGEDLDAMDGAPELIEGEWQVSLHPAVYAGAMAARRHRDESLSDATIRMVDLALARRKQ